MKRLFRILLLTTLCVALLVPTVFADTITSDAPQKPDFRPVISMVVIEVNAEKADVHDTHQDCNHIPGKIIYSAHVQSEIFVDKSEVGNLIDVLTHNFINPEVIIQRIETCHGSPTGQHIYSSNKLLYNHIRLDSTTCFTCENKLYECDYCDYAYAGGQMNPSTHTYGSLTCLYYPAPL